MSASEPVRTASRRTRSTIRAAFLLANLAVAGVFIHQSLALSSAPVASTGGAQDRALGAADGAVGQGVTVFDDEVPAVVNLDPALLSALRTAAKVAAGDGVAFYVNSERWHYELRPEAVERGCPSRYPDPTHDPRMQR